MIAPSLMTVALNVSGVITTALAHDDINFKKIDIRTEPLLINSRNILLLVASAVK